MIYDDALDFYNGLAAVKSNGKYGFIDKSGKTVITFIYEDAKSFEGRISKAKVQLNGEWIEIDKTGKVADENPFYP